MDSSNLHTTEVRLWGDNYSFAFFEKLCLSPFLKIGVTLAFFQSAGISPSFIDLVKICCKGSFISLAHSFSNCGFISSGPHALCSFKSFIFR